MKLRFRHLRYVLAFAIALVGASAGTASICVGGDDWPTRAVKIIVPFSAGSANDVSARLYADGLARRWWGHPGTARTGAAAKRLTCKGPGQTTPFWSCLCYV